MDFGADEMEEMEIYVSAVGEELQSAREVVAKRLRAAGFSPVWMEITPDEKTDLRDALSRKVGRCQAVIQLVGHRYGPEPSQAIQPLGRVSYAQHEAMCARQRGQKVWHFILGEDFRADTPEPEGEDLGQLQAAYRRRIRTFADSLESCGRIEDLEAQILQLRGPLFRLRHRFSLRLLTLAATALIGISVGKWWWQARARETPRTDADTAQPGKLLPALRASAGSGRS